MHRNAKLVVLGWLTRLQRRVSQPQTSPWMFSTPSRVKHTNLIPRPLPFFTIIGARVKKKHTSLVPRSLPFKKKCKIPFHMNESGGHERWTWWWALHPNNPLNFIIKCSTVRYVRLSWTSGKFALRFSTRRALPHLIHLASISCGKYFQAFTVFFFLFVLFVCFLLLLLPYYCKCKT